MNTHWYHQGNYIFCLKIQTAQESLLVFYLFLNRATFTSIYKTKDLTTFSDMTMTIHKHTHPGIIGI